MRASSAGGRAYAVAAVVLLALITLLSVYAWSTDQAAWEVNLVTLVQRSGPPGLSEIAKGLAIAGHGVPWMLVLGVIGTALWFAGNLRLVLLLGVVTALQDVGAVLKLIVERARPPAGSVEVWQQIGSYSFPSGHTLGATLVFGFLFFAVDHCDIPRHARAVLRCFSVAWIVLMGIGRVEVGAHWPTDVVGAYLIGALLLLPIVFYLRRPAV